MRKIIIFLVFFVLILTGCAANESETISNYRIVETAEPFVLRYEIMNNSGEVIKSFETNRPATLGFIGENIVELWVSAGTGIGWGVYYSVKDDMLSDVFDFPIAITGELILLSMFE